MGNTASGVQRSATTGRRRRNPLLRRGLSAGQRQRLQALQDNLNRGYARRGAGRARIAAGLR